jgi:hypothetical protein
MATTVFEHLSGLGKLIVKPFLRFRSLPARVIPSSLLRSADRHRRKSLLLRYDSGDIIRFPMLSDSSAPSDRLAGGVKWVWKRA